MSRRLLRDFAVLGVLAGADPATGMSAAEVAYELGIRQQAVFDALSRLKDGGRVRQGRACRWWVEPAKWSPFDESEAGSP